MFWIKNNNKKRKYNKKKLHKKTLPQCGRKICKKKIFNYQERERFLFYPYNSQ